jgi:hypothetical protein
MTTADVGLPAAILGEIGIVALTVTAPTSMVIFYANPVQIKISSVSQLIRTPVNYWSGIIF